MKWNVTITLPAEAPVGAITQESLTTELEELCRAGLELDDDEFTVEVSAAPAPAAQAEAPAAAPAAAAEEEEEPAQRTGTEG